MLPGGLGHLGPTQSSNIDLKLKIYVENTCFEHFIFTLEKILLLIFQTLFTENCPFFDNFDQNLFLHELQNDFDKNGSKRNSKIENGRATNSLQFQEKICFHF